MRQSQSKGLPDAMKSQEVLMFKDVLEIPEQFVGHGIDHIDITPQRLNLPVETPAYTSLDREYAHGCRTYR